MSGPHYVATHRGFLCEDPARGYYLTFDIRWATPFPTFEAADQAARVATVELTNKLAGVIYYAILIPAASGFGGDSAQEENNG